MLRNKRNAICRSISAKQVATATRIKDVIIKRKWYQLSLKSIFTLVTLSSICFCYFGIKMQQANRQRQAVKVILKSGGRVEYDYQAKNSGQTASPRWRITRKTTSLRRSHNTRKKGSKMLPETLHFWLSSDSKRARSRARQLQLFDEYQCEQQPCIYLRLGAVNVPVLGL